MAKRKYNRRSSKKNNSLKVFFVIVIIIALLAFVISYLVMQTESKADKNITDKQETKSSTIVSLDKHTLEGTWASYDDGAMLTIKGRNFSIEQPSVDSPVVVSGRIVIKDSQATFVYTTQDSECGIKPGVYEFKFEGNDEVKFTKVDDHCGSRNDRLSATWFKV